MISKSTKYYDYLHGPNSKSLTAHQLKLLQSLITGLAGMQNTYYNNPLHQMPYFLHKGEAHPRDHGMPYLRCDGPALSGPQGSISRANDRTGTVSEPQR